MLPRGYNNKQNTGATKINDFNFIINLQSSESSSQFIKRNIPFVVLLFLETFTLSHTYIIDSGYSLKEKESEGMGSY